MAAWCTALRWKTLIIPIPTSGEMAWAKTEQIPYEYACHEGNHALPGILAGGRLREVEHRERNGLNK